MNFVSLKSIDASLNVKCVFLKITTWPKTVTSFTAGCKELFVAHNIIH